MHIREVGIIILRATWRHITNGKSWINTTNGIVYMRMHVASLLLRRSKINYGVQLCTENKRCNVLTKLISYQPEERGNIHIFIKLLANSLITDFVTVAPMWYYQSFVNNMVNSQHNFQGYISKQIKQKEQTEHRISHQDISLESYERKCLVELGMVWKKKKEKSGIFLWYGVVSNGSISNFHSLNPFSLKLL